MSNGGTNENPDTQATDTADVERERYELLQRLEEWLETPMLVLAFVWLLLLILELIQGESRLFYFGRPRGVYCASFWRCTPSVYSAT